MMIYNAHYGNLLYVSILNSIPALKARGITPGRIAQFEYLAKLIEGYQREKDMMIDIHTVNNNDLIAFGLWLKEPGEFTYTEKRTDQKAVRRPKSNSSVMFYLNSIQSHLRDNDIYHINIKKIRRSFPSKSRELCLDEDIVQAILDTEVTKSRHYLDAVKLIILHGFRYSDLWMLRKMNCIKQTDDGLQYFNYFPAKNYNSMNNREKGVTIPVHPAAKPILRYWENKDTASWLPIERTPKALLDKEYSPHIIYRGGRSSAVFFNRPIIKIPYYVFEKSIKRKIFTAVHNTWYATKYGINWDESYEPEGLMRETVVKGKTYKLYETFTYHFFRHVYCTRYLSKGGSLFDLKENVGHSDIRRTMRYLHDNTEDRLKRSFLLTQ
jgi:integrase